jgi:pimeloyl-ACP methyl ester carboxylesterase
VPDRVANGITFNTQVLGAPDGAADRPAVVMLHGLVMDNLSSWYMTIANPVAKVADVHLYDLRGHGRTERPPTGYTIGDNVDDLEALLDVWGLDRPVHLVGNSFGCVVALELARRSPDRVASLVLVEAHYAETGWGEDLAASLDRVTTGMADVVVRDYLAELAGRKFKRLVANAEALLTGTTMREDLRAEPGVPIERFGEITCPTLALFGADSDIIDRGRALDAAMPSCELHVLEGCSHSLLMEAGGLVAAEVAEWVTRHDARLVATTTGEVEP